MYQLARRGVAPAVPQRRVVRALPGD